jgi:hypothetical protein
MTFNWISEVPPPINTLGVDKYLQTASPAGPSAAVAAIEPAHSIAARATLT